MTQEQLSTFTSGTLMSCINKQRNCLSKLIELNYCNYHTGAGCDIQTNTFKFIKFYQNRMFRSNNLSRKSTLADKRIILLAVYNYNRCVHMQFPDVKPTNEALNSYEGRNFKRGQFVCSPSVHKGTVQVYGELPSICTSFSPDKTFTIGGQNERYLFYKMVPTITGFIVCLSTFQKCVRTTQIGASLEWSFTFDTVKQFAFEI